MKLEDRAALRREVRQHSVDFEVREGSKGSLSFEGFATTYGTPYRVEDFLGEYQEEFVEGAFRDTLKRKDDVPLLVNHAGLPLARTSSGTLDLSSVKTGLRVRSDLEPQDPDVQAIRYKMKRGDLSQMSIAFRAVQQEWSPNWDYRRITEAELYDVSIVTTPANPYTSAGLRSLDPATVELDDLAALVAKVRGVDDETAKRMLDSAAFLDAIVNATIVDTTEPVGTDGNEVDEMYLRCLARRYAA